MDYSHRSYLELNDLLCRMDPVKRPIGVVVSSRGHGKTSHTLLWCVNQFLLHGYKTIWCRTYGEDIKKSRLKDFFVTNLLTPVAQGKLHIAGGRTPKLQIRFGKDVSYATCDGQVFLTFLPLNIGRIAGSTVADTKYRIMVIDEFLVDPKRGERELPEVVSSAAHIAQTVFRNRPYRMLLLGNPYTTASQWFDWLGIDWRKVRVNHVSAPKNKPYALLWLVGSKHSGEMKKSTFGVMFGNSHIAESSINGQFVDDNNTMIIDPKDYIKDDCLLNFKTDDGQFGLWYDRYNGLLVCSKTLGREQPVMVQNETNAESSSYLLRSLHGTGLWQRLRKARMFGRLRFESQSIMAIAIPILDKILI